MLKPVVGLNDNRFVAVYFSRNDARTAACLPEREINARARAGRGGGGDIIRGGEFSGLSFFRHELVWLASCRI